MKPIIERSYRGMLWALALGATFLDQVTKYNVFRSLYDGDKLQGHRDLIPGAFELFARFTPRREAEASLRRVVEGSSANSPLLNGLCGWIDAVTVRKNAIIHPLRTWSGELLPNVNQGALFGLGQKYAELANAVFALVSIVAALAIIYWSTRRSTARDFSLCAALGLILAGTLGNLYDRVVFDGVRDFLYWHLWFEWPVFNLADCCLVCGAFFLLLQAFWSRSAPAEKVATNVVPQTEMAKVN